MKDGSVSDAVTVTVSGGFVDAIQPRGARVAGRFRGIDGRGGFVIPGLVDAHVHLPDAAFAEVLHSGRAPTLKEQERDLGPYLAAGITSIVVMSGSPDLLVLRDSIDRGEVRGPRLVVGSPFVAGTHPILPPPVSRRVATPRAAADLVLALRAEGYDFVKLREDLTPEMATAAVNAGNMLGIPVFGHLPRSARTVDQFFSGPGAGAAHLYDLLQLDRARSGDFAGLARQLRDRRAVIVTTLSVHANIMAKNADFAATLRSRCADVVAPQLFSMWTGMAFAPSSDSRRISAQMQEQGRLLRVLADHGVSILAGTDAGAPTIGPGCSLHAELELMVAAGLSPLEALRTATTAPARTFARLHGGGETRAGGPADLVLLRDNPLEDIGNVRHIEGVMAAGRWMDRNRLLRAIDVATLRTRGLPRPAASRLPNVRSD
jgi:imidazolonepropionase-like amidohydrolase